MRGDRDSEQLKMQKQAWGSRFRTELYAEKCRAVAIRDPRVMGKKKTYGRIMGAFFWTKWARKKNKKLGAHFGRLAHIFLFVQIGVSKKLWNEKRSNYPFIDQHSCTLFWEKGHLKKKNLWAHYGRCAHKIKIEEMGSSTKKIWAAPIIWQSDFWAPITLGSLDFKISLWTLNGILL